MFNRPLLVLYGGETGNARDVAETLWTDARYRNIPALVYNMKDYTIQDLEDERCVVFVVATSGQGQMPTSIRHNWRILCSKSLPNDLLSTVCCAVLGLGDSTYQKYNFAGKKLYRRLNQLGALFLTELALADDQHEMGIDGAYEPFRDSLFREIWKMELYPDMVLNPDESKCLPPRYFFEFTEDFSIPYGSSEESFVKAVVVSNKRLTSENHFQDTRLISMDAVTGELSYSPGDVLMVYPYNLRESLDMTFEILGYDDSILDHHFKLRPTEESFQQLPPELFEDGLTLRRCFERYFDLQIVPRRSFFRTLGKLSTVKYEKERLLELAKNIDDYMDYCWRPRRTTAETLRDFQATARNIPPEMLFDVFSPIRPRSFSIASCPLTHKNVQLLVAKVEYRSKRLPAPRLGLCSTYLSRLAVGDTVLVKIGPGTFRWPDKNSALVLVGPGTGVAPFRSILASRKQQLRGEKENSILFFGCRGKEKDFYFGDQWHLLTEARVITAFSRDQESKIYVQHKIEEYGDDLWHLLTIENGHIFIAGRADDMPREVTECLEKIAAGKGEDGEKFVEKLEASGRMQYETWH